MVTSVTMYKSDSNGELYDTKEEALATELSQKTIDGVCEFVTRRCKLHEKYHAGIIDLLLAWITEQEQETVGLFVPDKTIVGTTP